MRLQARHSSVGMGLQGGGDRGRGGGGTSTKLVNFGSRVEMIL